MSTSKSQSKVAQPKTQTSAKNEQIQAQLDYFATHQNLDFPFAFQINSGQISHKSLDKKNDKNYVENSQTNSVKISNNSQNDLENSLENNSKTSKHLVFVAALHGNEPAGVEAIIRFHQHFVSKNLKLKHGKITFVLGSPESFAGGVRFIDQNLNRAFGSFIDNYETNRAKEFKTFFQNEPPDCLLDFHSVSRGDFKVVIFQDQKSQEFAKKISSLEIHFLPHVEHLPGSLMQLASSFGSLAIALECGNHTSPTAPDIALFHLQKTLEHFEMLDSKDFLPVEIENSQNQIFYQTLSIIKPQLNFKFVNPEATTGTFVKKGETFATFQKPEETLEQTLEKALEESQKFEQKNEQLSDKTGQNSYTANSDCFLMMPDHNPNVTDFDAGFLCSREQL